MPFSTFRLSFDCRPFAHSPILAFARLIFLAILCYCSTLVMCFASDRSLPLSFRGIAITFVFVAASNRIAFASPSSFSTRRFVSPRVPLPRPFVSLARHHWTGFRVGLRLVITLSRPRYLIGSLRSSGHHSARFLTETPTTPHRSLALLPILIAHRSAHYVGVTSKLRIFEDIMITSKRTAATQGQFGPTVAADWEDPSARASPALSSSNPADGSYGSTVSDGAIGDAVAQNGAVWDAEASERRIEAERERSLADKGIAQQTGSTWDRLRQQNVPRQTASASPTPARPANPLDLTTTTQSKYAPGLSVEDKIAQETDEERRREQEAFERLMDREREAAATGKEETFERW